MPQDPDATQAATSVRATPHAVRDEAEVDNSGVADGSGKVCSSTHVSPRFNHTSSARDSLVAWATRLPVR